MENENNYFYAKFKVDATSGLMERMFISEDEQNIKKWVAEDKADVEEKGDDKPRVDNLFSNIMRDFERSILSYQTAAPFMMGTLSYLRNVSDDKSIRGFAKEHGTLVEAGSFETYKMNVEYFNKFVRRAERSVAIASSLNALPNMFLVSLVSTYDAFLSKLIRAIFISRPEILSSSEKNISFKDLVEIGSIDAARERIIEKEVETALRSSHAEQISWLETKLDMKLTKDLKIWSDFIEICERRNLLTHTDGVVSSQYLKVCRDHGYDTKSMHIGQKLFAGRNYLSRSVDIVLEFGVKLTQVVWRKIMPFEVQLADESLDSFGYRLITEQKYKLASTIFQFGLFEMKKHGDQATRKRMIINYANAEKLGGDKASAAKILDREDWSATTDNYKICVAAIKDDMDIVVNMMKRVVETKTVKISDLREWAVFEQARSHPRFLETFEREFNQKLFMEREAKIPVEEDSSKQPEPDAGM